MVTAVGQGDGRKLLSKRAAGISVGVSADTIRRAILAGRLPVVVVHKREFVPAEALDVFRPRTIGTPENAEIR